MVCPLKYASASKPGSGGNGVGVGRDAGVGVAGWGVAPGGSGVGVAVGVRVGAAVGVEGIASIVAWTPACTVAWMSGVGSGVSSASALATAAWTISSMSGMGSGGGAQPEAIRSAAATREKGASLPRKIRHRTGISKAPSVSRSRIEAFQVAAQDRVPFVPGQEVAPGLEE